MRSFGASEHSPIKVFESPDKPRLTTVERTGDPAAAIAAAVVTDSDTDSAVALSSLVAYRLKKAGIRGVDTQADRLGYRVRALVSTATDTPTLLAAFRTALLTPVSADPLMQQHVAQALARAKRKALPASQLDAVAACTGQLGNVPGKKPPNMTGAPGAKLLEQWRATFHGTNRVAIAAVGNTTLASDVRNVLQSQAPWPTAAPLDDPWPDTDTVAAFPLIGSSSRAPQLTIAMRLAPSSAASYIAEQLLSSNAAEPSLDTTLSAASSWKLARAQGTVRPRGGCVAVTLLRDESRQNADLAQDAARAAAHVIADVQSRLNPAYLDSSVGSQRVLATEDPRIAAELAAWWSMASQLEPGPMRTSVVLAVPNQTGAHGSTATDSAQTLEKAALATESALEQALPAMIGATKTRQIQSAATVETGQGKFWLLLASPCGTTAETEADAGYTALSVLASVYAAAAKTNVALEPWVSQDGVGVIAHSTPNPGESPEALARRVAGAAALALLGPAAEPPFITTAKNRVLSLLDTPARTPASAQAKLAVALAPEHPAWIAPFGLYKPVMAADTKNVQLRHATIAQGPLSIAVVANDTEKQAQTAINAVDHWIIQRNSTPPRCPAVVTPTSNQAEPNTGREKATPAKTANSTSETPLSISAKTSANTATSQRNNSVTVIDKGAPPHAIVGLAINRPTELDIAALELTAELLQGPQSLLTQALAQLPGPVSVRVTTQGQHHITAMSIEFHCAPSLIDKAVEKTLQVLQNMQRGATTTLQWQQASDKWTTKRLTSTLDPRQRLVQLWRQNTHQTKQIKPAPSQTVWSNWASRQLRSDRTVVIRVNPETE